MEEKNLTLTLTLTLTLVQFVRTPVDRLDLRTGNEKQNPHLSVASIP